MNYYFEVDKYLSKRFDLRTYNCWHFALEVWEDLTLERIHDFTPKQLSQGALKQAASDASMVFVKVTNTQYRQPLFVLATTPCDSPHIGVLYNNKVLHLRKEGARYESLEAFLFGFYDIAFYTTASRAL